MEAYIQWFESIPVEMKILYFTVMVVFLVALLGATSLFGEYRFRKIQPAQQPQPLPTSLTINTTAPGVREKINELLLKQELEPYGDQIIAALHQKLAFLNQKILEYKDTEIPNYFFRGELNKAKRLVFEKAKKEHNAELYMVMGMISYVELDFNDCYQRLKTAQKMAPGHEKIEAEFDEIATLLETRVKQKKSFETA